LVIGESVPECQVGGVDLLAVLQQGIISRIPGRGLSVAEQGEQQTGEE